MNGAVEPNRGAYITSNWPAEIAQALCWTLRSLDPNPAPYNEPCIENKIMGFQVQQVKFRLLVELWTELRDRKKFWQWSQSVCVDNLIAGFSLASTSAIK